MRSVSLWMAAGAASLVSSAGLAADLSVVPSNYAPPPVEDFGGWYLRGDIGMTNSRGKLDNSLLYPTAQSLQHVGQGFSGGTSFGVGAGYQFNSWFRADITGEYRSKVNFTGTDYSVNPTSLYGAGVTGPHNSLTTPISDTYNGGYSSWVGLVNAYADLGTWWCLTPFVGAGVGAAYNKTSGFSDQGTSGLLYAPLGGPPGTPGYLGYTTPYVQTSDYNAAGAGKLNFAWALHAGVGYKVTNNFTVEFAYRYLNMGSAVHGFGQSFDGSNAGTSHFQYLNLTSQELRVGLRWTCCDLPPPPPPPIIRKG
jgi:opacity protein-like surface antigen